MSGEAWWEEVVTVGMAWEGLHVCPSFSLKAASRLPLPELLPSVIPLCHAALIWNHQSMA